MAERAGASAAVHEKVSDSNKKWGRVLIAGGVDWTRLGKKEKAGTQTEYKKKPDLLRAHILRSLANVEAVSIHTSPGGCHCIVLDINGSAWLFGRNSSYALGVAGVDEISENAPRHLTPKSLKAAPGTRFVHAACGKTHSLLVGSGGELWSTGLNVFGQCGHPVSHAEIVGFKLVDGLQKKAVKAAAGITFSAVLTEAGTVYTFGSGEKGQLGNGRTGEHITTGNKTAFDVQSEPLLVKGLQGKVIVDIASGNQHSLALDEEGFVYVFGYNGYCRLGLGDQQDALVPKTVPQFAGPAEITRALKVFAGPTNSIVVDRNRMFWMAGKWKNSGDGSSGQPYTTFKYLPDIMGCKIIHAASGGVTHFALCPDDDDDTVMTIGWGQNAANGELGLGEDEAKSATKPLRVNPLNGIDVFDIAAGQNTTFFLAKPNKNMSDLPRHPVELEDVPEVCVVCGEDRDDDAPLECDKCDMPYHLGCLKPQLDAVPDEEWFCERCIAEPGAPIGGTPKMPKTMGTKPTRVTSPEPGKGQKRKAGQSGQKGNALKRKK